MSEIQREWAVRWPDGSFEPCSDEGHAARMLRLYTDVKVISRTITYGLWSDDDLAKRLVEKYVNEYGNGRLQAIRDYREQTDCSLLEARDAIYAASGRGVA